MVNPKEISVIVQGAIDQELTPKCLKSIRKHLPHAEIILSTWDGSDVSKLDYNILVLNEDPGGIKHDYAIYNASRSMNNFNRQLVSTRNGITKARHKYILKLRTDLELTNTDFLNYWDLFNYRNTKYVISHHRILCSCLYSRENSCQSGTGYPTPFHPSDFWLFGETDDIENYFLNCPLQTKDEGGNWTFKYPTRVPYHTALWRFSPEQFFCYHWVKQYYPYIEFDDWSDWNQKNIELSNNILYNNFIFLGYEQSGIYSGKHNYAESIKNYLQGLITYELFQNRYKKYCDKNYICNVKFYDNYKDKLQNNYKKKLEKHFNRLINPFRKLNSWFGEIISTVFYLFLFVCNLLKKGTKNDKQ